MAHFASPEVRLDAPVKTKSKIDDSNSRLLSFTEDVKFHV